MNNIHFITTQNFTHLLAMKKGDCLENKTLLSSKHEIKFEEILGKCLQPFFTVICIIQFLLSLKNVSL